MLRSIQERNKLIEDNIGLVHHVAKKYRARLPLDYEDIVQTGMRGLVKAADGYDPTIAKFSTHAVYYIRSEISHLARDTFLPKRYPRKAPMSLNQSIKNLDGLTIQDELMDKTTDIEDYCVAKIDIERALASADARTQRVMGMRYKGYSQVKIAKELDVSQVLVSRIIAKFKRRIATH